MTTPRQNDTVTQEWGDDSKSQLSGDYRKDCCKKEDNLGPVVRERADLIYRRCRVCGCRHFELSVDPGKLSLRGVQI